MLIFEVEFEVFQCTRYLQFLKRQKLLALSLLHLRLTFFVTAKKEINPFGMTLVLLRDVEAEAGSGRSG